MCAAGPGGRVVARRGRVGVARVSCASRRGLRSRPAAARRSEPDPTTKKPATMALGDPRRRIGGRGHGHDRVPPVRARRGGKAVSRLAGLCGARTLRRRAPLHRGSGDRLRAPRRQGLPPLEGVPSEGRVRAHGWRLCRGSRRGLPRPRRVPQAGAMCGGGRRLPRPRPRGLCGEPGLPREWCMHPRRRHVHRRHGWGLHERDDVS